MNSQTMQFHMMTHLVIHRISAAPGRYWAPSGLPPWIEGAQVTKRQCLSTPFPTCISHCPSMESSIHRHIDAPSLQRPLQVSEQVPSTAHGSSQHAVISKFMKDAEGPPSVYHQLSIPWSGSSNPRIRAPPPQEVLHTLRRSANSGIDVKDTLDLVSRARAAVSVKGTSWSTYSSHLKSVCHFCDLLQAEVVPATLQTVRRYTAVCNNPVTLRDHLAAWRLVHTVFGYPWAGDRDPFIRAAHSGIRRLQLPPNQKMSIRRISH